MDERRRAYEPHASAHSMGQLLQRTLVVFGTCRGSSEIPAHAASKLLAPTLFEACDIQLRVPDVKVAAAGKVLHRRLIFIDGGADHLAALLVRHTEFTACDLQAGGEPLQVPFPWAGQSLVEIVDVEYQRSLRRGEAAEVAHVRVTVELGTESAVRRFRQIG